MTLLLLAWGIASPNRYTICASCNYSASACGLFRKEGVKMEGGNSTTLVLSWYRRVEPLLDLPVHRRISIIQEKK